ncbi:hypothetical protein VTN31DRAFT_5860 [Thermomyces dupontii]|uniref:uncharacterized protein n=1 Tax=Talaromyces thermophilus TaxID=28565 RepID=UPI003742798C
MPRLTLEWTSYENKSSHGDELSAIARRLSCIPRLDGFQSSEDGSHHGTEIERYYDEVYGAFEKAGYEVRPGPKLEE